MYLSQQIEEVKGIGSRVHYTGIRLNWYCVELDASGRPAWKYRREAGTWWRATHSPSDLAGGRTRARAYGKRVYEGAVPFMSDAAHGKLVTGSQAMKLTGVEHPMAALDFLRDQLEADPNNVALQNYVKPPKAKEPKPEPVLAVATPLDVNQTKLAKARAKVVEWEARVKHANEKLREWRKSVKYRERRAHKLGAATTSSS